METQMMCELLACRSCSSEKQAFFAMHIWATKFPHMKWRVSGMHSSLEDIIMRTKSFQPETPYSSVSINIYNRDIYNVRSFKHGPAGFRSSLFSLALVNSEMFKVFAKIGFNSKQNARFVQSVVVVSKGTYFRFDESLLRNSFNR